MRRQRTIKPVLPAQMGSCQGLAYSLWLPDRASSPAGGVIILHGAGSCKESHHDFARGVIGAGMAAIAFDQRGHGESEGPMDARVLGDIVAIARLLRSAAGDEQLPLAVRGSSMGGYLAILAAPLLPAAAVVAICPASAAGLRRGLEAGAFEFQADFSSLDAFLAEHDLETAVRSLTMPLLLLHAVGDEQVPIEHSRQLAEQFGSAGSRLIAVPGGHHRSIQHDHELQAVSLRFIERALTPAR